eukprot:14481485-Ditylum_brightwellii.AAC.1
MSLGSNSVNKSVPINISESKIMGIFNSSYCCKEIIIHDIKLGKGSLCIQLRIKNIGRTTPDVKTVQVIVIIVFNTEPLLDWSPSIGARSVI